MRSRLETFHLGSGNTEVRMGVNTSDGGAAGVYANWGVRYPREQLIEKIIDRTGVPAAEVSGETGFDEGWHQPDDMTREEAGEIQLEVLRTAIDATLEVNQWTPGDVDALVLGSGVPIADIPGKESYVDVVADMMGFTNLKVKRQTYAACNSGQYNIVRALEDPELQGMNVLAPSVEGVTHLMPNFDPKLANPTSMLMFSDGIGVLGFIPGVDYSIYESVHRVLPDRKGYLAAEMTYKDIIDWEAIDRETFDTNPGQIWQVFPETADPRQTRTELIVGPEPPEGMMINMQPGTAIFFIDMVEDMMGELHAKHMLRHPQEPVDFYIAHHPHIKINEKARDRLERKRGIRAEIPWVVRSGNSSAATSTMAWVHLLDRIEPGKTYGSIAYGAGGSGTAATMRAGSRDTHRQEQRRKVFSVK